MTLRGHILNGTVVLDEPVKLPDGTSVEVDVRPSNQATEAADAAWRRYRSLGERLAATSVCGAPSLTDQVSQMRR